VLAAAPISLEELFAAKRLPVKVLSPPILCATAVITPLARSVAAGIGAVSFTTSPRTKLSVGPLLSVPVLQPRDFVGSQSVL